MREVILSSYELDYFDEDLIVVLYNSVSFWRAFFIIEEYVVWTYDAR